jgi:hypothetical protein
MRDHTSDETGLNVLHKGYRSTLAAQLQGQHCFQPDFAQCDRKFNGAKTLHSAAVAFVFSGNERAVRLVKMSWVIKKGAVHVTRVDHVLRFFLS